MKNILLIVAIVAVGAGGFLFLNNKQEPQPSVNDEMMDEMMETETEDIMEADKMMEDGDKMMDGAEESMMDDEKMMDGDSMMAGTKEFTVVGTPFEFSVKELRVKKGDTVKITFRNDKGTHDWVVDEFNARTKVIQAGQSETITFVADKTGTFEYYCSVMQHRQMGMVGKLIVE